MMIKPDTDQYLDLFLNDIPMMDVRAPVEFNKGAFPCSVNIPLLDDEQRQAVGICYKQKGQNAAIELGWRLATPAIQAERITTWQEFVSRHPEGYLYCFRGGLRSRLSQQLLAQAGSNYPLVKGGYKAMRRFLIDELDEHCSVMPLTLVAGRTGSGKTLFIEQMSNAVDLEGIAMHRGSAFGRRLQAQPTQINFENNLSVAFLKQRHSHRSPVFVEDEGRMIGALSLPMSLLNAMSKAPLVVLETPIADRIELVLVDYISEAYPEYLAHFGEEQGFVHFREQILGNLNRIRKRLGSDRFKYLYAEFSQALDHLQTHDNADGFRVGIKLLLRDYYDPMYDYQQGQRQGRVVFRGERAELRHWLQGYRVSA